MEGLWDQVKVVLCNRVFAMLGELKRVLAAWLRAFWQDALRVQSLDFQ